MTKPLPTRGQPPLTARLEPWMTELLADPQQCAALMEQYASPVNVVFPAVLPRNAAELVDAGVSRGVDVRVFFARKANKALGFVEAARDAGHGIDVASECELRQVLGMGVEPQRIILSAAIKPDALLQFAIAQGVTISTDSLSELDRIAAHTVALNAEGQNVRAQVAPRIAPDPQRLPPTRFGEVAQEWIRGSVGKEKEHVDVVGVHAHLHGYAESDRRAVLADCLEVIDELREQGQRPTFIDLGGGVPMSYLDSADEWEEFTKQRQLAVEGKPTQLRTWKDNPLATTYPFHQTPTRGAWLEELLDGDIPGYGNAADALNSRELALHLEPGRSLLDGGGVILARVAFVKKRSDGVDLVGLEMNRTQCKTTSDDILLDPLVVPTARAAEGADDAEDVRKSNRGRACYLVGAYCIEDEVIIWRRLTFPEGVAPGDCVAIPNTAGYFMHILESASHQIPLANNVVCKQESALEFFQDAIDGAN